MAGVSKRARLTTEKAPPGKIYAPLEAFELLKELSATTRFTESVDASVNLGVDVRKSDQVVRGISLLPHGTGRQVKVIVFAQQEQAEAARQAGADVVGHADLIPQIEQGKLKIDWVVATPDSMPVVGRLGKFLGPRGLMPNPKTGTVTADVAQAVKNIRNGQVRYRTDSSGIVHCMLGKTNFEANALKGNLDTLLVDLGKLKPSGAKGIYFKKVTVSTTMGPGLSIDLGALPS